ncbi:MAG: DNA replication and repair protein RecF [bacterium]
MRIVEAKILNFRNLEETAIEFSSRVNLFLGENGQGKTNLLEALNFIAFGRSHRGNRNEEMIRFTADHLHVSMTVEEEGAETKQFEYAVTRQGKRRFHIDGQEVKKRAELVGNFTSVFFDPNSIGLVRGGPRERRQYIDRGLAVSAREHLPNLQSYLRALRQKARLLQEIKKAKKSIIHSQPWRDEITAWNQEMAKNARAIYLGRADYSLGIKPFANQVYQDLSTEDKELDFIYKPRFEGNLQDYDEGDLEQEIFTEFDYIVDKEISRGRPLIGPHLDDFAVTLDGVDLRSFGSQGETRTAAIALILAQSEVLFQKRHIRPVLFFDDIFSELDRKRSRQLQEKSIQQHQVFIATARNEDISGWSPAGSKSWQITSGELEAKS